VSFANALLKALGGIKSDFVAQISTHEVEDFLVGHQVVEDSILVASAITLTRGLGEEDWDSEYQCDNEESEDTEDCLKVKHTS
jgi:hypothetical protein